MANESIELGSIASDETLKSVAKATQAIGEKLDLINESIIEYNNAAVNPHGLPPGGETGQVLAKGSDVDNDTDWQDIADLIPDGSLTRSKAAASWMIKKQIYTDGENEQRSIYDPTQIIPDMGVAKWGEFISAPGFIATGFMELPEGSIIISTPYMAKNLPTICFYDENKVFIPPHLEWEDYTFPIIPNPRAKYVATTIMQHTDPDSFDFMVQYELDTEQIYADNALSVPQRYITSQWEGAKMNVLGDSLVQAEGYVPFHQIAMNALGLSFVRNYGLGWSAVGQITTDHYNPNVVVTDERRPFILRAPEMSDDADIVAFLPGVGELFYNVPLGTIDDPEIDAATGLTVTVYAGLKRLCRILMEKYPNAALICIKPPAITQTSIDKVEAYWKAIYDVCPRYGVVVCDTAMSRLDFNQRSSSSLAPLSPDGIHMTNLGHKHMAKSLIKTLMYDVIPLQ